MIGLLQYIARYFLTSVPRLLYFLAALCAAVFLVTLKAENAPFTTLELAFGLGGSALFLSGLGALLQYVGGREPKQDQAPQ